jgi:hypothetical protein
MTMETLETMRASRVYTDDLESIVGGGFHETSKVRGYAYFAADGGGGFWIEDRGGGVFSAAVCNGEHVGTLAECEAYLWENWVRDQVNG